MQLYFRSVIIALLYLFRYNYRKATKGLRGAWFVLCVLFLNMFFTLLPLTGRLQELRPSVRVFGRWTNICLWDLCLRPSVCLYCKCMWETNIYTYRDTFDQFLMYLGPHIYYTCLCLPCVEHLFILTGEARGWQCEDGDGEREVPIWTSPALHCRHGRCGTP